MGVFIGNFGSAHSLAQLLPERDYVTFTSVLSQIRLSSVTFVRPTQGLKLSAVFLSILYTSHPLTAVQNFTEIVPGEPLHRGR